jgi:hypothetical protein
MPRRTNSVICDRAKLASLRQAKGFMTQEKLGLMANVAPRDGGFSGAALLADDRNCLHVRVTSYPCWDEAA